MLTRPPASPSGPALLPACLGLAILAAGCGGGAGARPIPDPEPAPVQGTAEPAVRLDNMGAAEAVPGGSADRPAAPGKGRARSMQSDSYHELRPGQTLYSLARAYGVPLERLLRANGISDPTTVRAGTAILIPGLPLDRPPAASPRSSLPSRDSLALSWPLHGSITSHFGRRSRHRHHEGIDIDGVKGETIVAAAPGTVVEADTRHGYGRLVVIDHGGGVATLYAHASHLLVREGDEVRRGEPIAEVGRTGNAHGSHLHFEVHKDGHPVDPLALLRSGAVTVSNPRPAQPEASPAEEPSRSADPPSDDEEDDQAR